MTPAEHGGTDRQSTMSQQMPQLTQLTDTQLDELLGAYALNAVDDSERDSIERYLARSPRARAEVADHLMVAAALGSTPSEAPLPLWDRIVDQLLDRPNPSESTEPVPSVVIPFERPTTSPGSTQASSRAASRKPRLLGWVASAAAAAAAIGFIGVQNSRHDDRYDDLQTELASAQTAKEQAETAKEQAETAQEEANIATAKAQAIAESSLSVERLISRSDTKVADLELDGVKLARVVIGADGKGFLVSDKRFGLANGEVLQLWGVHNDQVISLGVMPDGVTSMPLSAAGDWSQFVLTAEQNGGVVKSDGPALAAGTFSA